MKLSSPMCPVCGKHRGLGTDHRKCNEITRAKYAGTQKRGRPSKLTPSQIEYVLKGVK